MLVGIDASRAFIKQRTGIEEYSYQIIKSLRNELDNDQACPPMRRVVLYVRKNQIIDFDLPENWQIKVIKFPYLWTQVGLSLEMLFYPVDALFIPAHTVPIIHPKKTIVTIHGLEYEFCPKAYSLWERLYMRFSIKNSCRWANKIISVSNNTKKDLMRLYGVAEEKIEVVHEGCGAGANFEFRISNFESKPNFQNSNLEFFSKFIRHGGQNSKILLFIGRLEKRKNILGIIRTFEILKEKYSLSHKLVLAGKFGYGEEEIKNTIEKSKYKKDVVLLGYVSEQEKWQLLENAAVFLFPSFYEGFGLPILEAQSAGVPVIASNISSLPEITGGSAFLIDPNDHNGIAETINKLISDNNLREDIIKKGYENIQRFSWEKCASKIAEILIR